MVGGKVDRGQVVITKDKTDWEKVEAIRFHKFCSNFVEDLENIGKNKKKRGTL